MGGLTLGIEAFISLSFWTSLERIPDEAILNIELRVGIREHITCIWKFNYFHGKLSQKKMPQTILKLTYEYQLSIVKHH